MKPLIIITLRRSGSTSFTRLVRKHVGPGRVLGEPLNPGNAWGHVTSEYKFHKDRARAGEQMAEGLKDPLSIKHCIDNVPIELTKALIDVARNKDYRFVVLTRRDQVARIRSLAMAQMTGHWGSKRRFVGDGEEVPKKLNWKITRKAKKQLVFGLRATHATLQYLRHRSIDFKHLVFEELFYDQEDQFEALSKVASDLGFDPKPEIIREVVDMGSGSQILAPKLWSQIKGSAKLDAQLEKICSKESML